MKVNLLGPKSVSSEGVENVFQLLNSSKGPMQFEVGFLEQSFPGKSVDWDTLFNHCDEYRRQMNIRTDEHVVLLTEFGNDKNWFAGSDTDARNHFVHTAEWDFYFGEIDDRFPVAYEVAITILHKLVAEKGIVDTKNLVHIEPRGCVSDLCQDKKDIKLKMRTADICPSCIEHLKEARISRPLVQQVLQIIDAIRDSMTFRSRSSFFNTPSRLALKGDMCKVHLTDLGDLEVRLTPRQRALYVFFLHHPEGVPLSHLPDHREEIERLYGRFANLGENEAIETALNNLFEPFSGTLSTELSRIRAAFRSSVGEEMAKHYIVNGASGNPKSILLNRDLVIPSN